MPLIGAHMLLYSSEPEALRAKIHDVSASLSSMRMTANRRAASRRTRRAP